MDRAHRARLRIPITDAGRTAGKLTKGRGNRGRVVNICVGPSKISNQPASTVVGRSGRTFEQDRLVQRMFLAIGAIAGTINHEEITLHFDGDQRKMPCARGIVDALLAAR